MEFEPVSRASVSDGVFVQLVDAILAGDLAAGAALPSERDLAGSFQVNRHAVREALKRLRQAGLIHIAHGSKTTVLDWRAHAGLDTISAVARSGALPSSRLLLDFMEMRQAVASDAARLCARDADKHQLQEVVAAAAHYADAGPESVADVDLAFWRAVFAGAGNIAYQLAQNTLIAAYDDVGWDTIADLGVHAAEYSDPRAHVELARRIAAQDAAGARALADELLGRAVTAVAEAVKGVGA